MFTVMLKKPDGGEELFLASSVGKVPAKEVPSSEDDCGGREHVSFCAVNAVEGQAQAVMGRMLVDSGQVFVMNPEGQTVATYRF